MATDIHHITDTRMIRLSHISSISPVDTSNAFSVHLSVAASPLYLRYDTEALATIDRDSILAALALREV